MQSEDVRRVLESNSFKVMDQKRLGNNTGWQITLATGQIVNVFDKGTWHVQGKNPDPVKEILTRELSTAAEHGGASVDRSVFVVYGHDQKARDQLEAMLRRWDIDPIFLDQLPSAGQTIIEKLEKYQVNVQFAVVLATPDDEGHRAGHHDEEAFRARQNVVLELGMMLAILGRAKVAILLKAQDKIERPSDIQGLIYIPFKEDLKECALPLAKEMNSQGLKIDLSKL